MAVPTPPLPPIYSEYEYNGGNKIEIMVSGFYTYGSSDIKYFSTLTQELIKIRKSKLTQQQKDYNKALKELNKEFPGWKDLSK